MLSDRCLSVLSVYDVGVGLLWPNCWMDQDATWCGGRPRRTPHCVRRGPSSPQGSSSSSKKGYSSPPPLFGPCLLWPWLDGSRCHFVRR